MVQQVLMAFKRGGCSLCNGPPNPGVAIQGAVGRGGRNLPADVRTIQSALNAEAPPEGGPTVKLKVDGLAGPLTIAAIEKYQKRKIGWADGRVDPDGPTIHALTGDSGGLTPPAAKGGKKPKPIAPPKATPEQNTKFIERVGKLLPRTRHWVEIAQMKIEMASDFVHRAPPSRNDPFPSLHDIGKGELALFDKYFHSPKHPSTVKLHQLRQVRQIYDSMLTVITHSLLEAPMFGWGVGYFQPDPADGTLAANAYLAYTFYGGWHQRRRDGRPRLSGDDNYIGRKDLRQDTIFFPVGQLFNMSDNYLMKMLIHELSHFVGPGVSSSNRIADHTSESRPNFLTVNNWTALHTAECYAYFAAEAALGKIQIPIPV
jgi:hypothetical protein